MAVTKRPFLNIVVALLIVATVVSLCIPCWNFIVIDMEPLYLNADGTISANLDGGHAFVDDNGVVYSSVTRLNGAGVKTDGTTLIFNNKVPVGDLVENNTWYTMEGTTLAVDGKNLTVDANGLLTYLGGDTFKTTVTAPVTSASVAPRNSPLNEIAGDMNVNNQGQIVTAKKKAIQIPVVREEAASVMGYIALPYRRVGKLVTAMFEGKYEGFILNGQVWLPIIVFLLGIVATFVLLFVKRNTTNGLILPIVFAIAGIIVVWTNPLTRGGGLATTLLPSVLMALVAAVAIYNGNWLDTEGDWRRDPSAKGKIKEIKAAVGKKNLELLKSYVQSSDPSVRIAALDAIARIGGFNAFHPIVGQLSSSNADVRIAAAEALVTLGDPRGRTYLMYYMEEDPSPEVREAMNNALGKMPSMGA